MSHEAVGPRKVGSLGLRPPLFFQFKMFLFDAYSFFLFKKAYQRLIQKKKGLYKVISRRPYAHPFHASQKQSLFEVFLMVFTSVIEKNMIIPLFLCFFSSKIYIAQIYHFDYFMCTVALSTVVLWYSHHHKPSTEVFHSLKLNFCIQ